MGETMVRFAKTLRKRNGTLVYISQDLADLTKWEAGEALISNTGTKIILGLEDRVVAEIEADALARVHEEHRHLVEARGVDEPARC